MYGRAWRRTSWAGRRPCPSSPSSSHSPCRSEGADVEDDSAKEGWVPVASEARLDGRLWGLVAGRMSFFFTPSI